MALPFRVPKSFSDITRNFEYLDGRVETGGERFGIRFGTSTVTWPGGDSSAGLQTIPHGLGRQPSVVLLTAIGNSTVVLTELGGVTRTDAQFQVGAQTTDGSFPVVGTKCFFSWLAIG